MATSISSLGGKPGIVIVKDTAINATKAAQPLVVGLPLIGVTVTESGSGAAYLKLYDKQSGGVTVGTTDPDFIFLVATSANKHFPLLTIDADGRLGGSVFDDGFTYAAVTTGGTGGSSNPAGTVTATFYFLKV